LNNDKNEGLKRMYREFFIVYSEILNRYIIKLKFICLNCKKHSSFSDITLRDLDGEIFVCFNCKKEYSFDKGILKILRLKKDLENESRRTE